MLHIQNRKIHHFVKFVIYCIITTCSVECYWHCSEDTVHYKPDEMVDFAVLKCTTALPITVFINFVIYIYICCFLFPCMPKLGASNIP